MKSRKGMTLVEVMLAGSIAAFSVLALMEGLIVIAKVSRESSQILAAEAYAWDTAWKWLNISYEKLSGSTNWSPSDQGLEMAISEADCHALNIWPGSPPKCYVRGRGRTGVDVMNPPHGITGTTWKEIQVDVEWGPSGDRRCLNKFTSPGLNLTPRTTTARVCHIPISVTKCSIERGE